jgi:hypothetical protein
LGSVRWHADFQSVSFQAAGYFGRLSVGPTVFEFSELGATRRRSTLAVGRQEGSPKRLYICTRLHDVTHQKTVLSRSGLEELKSGINRHVISKYLDKETLTSPKLFLIEISLHFSESTCCTEFCFCRMSPL